MNGAVALGPTWDRIRAASPSLHPGQRRVADVLLAMSSPELARASAGDVAELSSTSPATVVRTCQQLGFSGFRECAMVLALDVGIARAADPDPDADDLLDPDAGTGREVSAPAFLRSVATALLHAAATVDETVLAAIAADIAAARRVLVVSYGWSAPSGERLALNLVALGLTVDSPNDFQRQIVAASTLGADDVCVLVCFTGSHRHAQLVARVAKERGAKVILVSTFSRSRTAMHADHNLIFGGLDTGVGRPDHPVSTVVQFATMEVIHLAVIATLGGPPEPTVTPALLALIEGGVDDDTG